MHRGLCAVTATGLLLAGCVIEPGTKPSQTATGTGEVKGKVVLTGVTHVSGIPVQLGQQIVTTGADGSYDFTGLPAGNVLVIARAPSTLEGTVSATVKVTSQSVSAPDLVFTPVGEITGTVTLGAATGNAGITVAAAGTSAFATTDDSGHYTLAGVPIGTHEVVASYPGYAGITSSPVGVTYNNTTAASPLTLVKTMTTGTGTLSGTVVLTGVTDASGVAVTLSGEAGAATQTDASGAYQFTGLPAGDYVVTAVATSTLELTQVVRVTVTSEPATAPALTFTPLGIVTGTATLGAATGNAGIAAVAMGSSAVGVTDDAGHYTLRGVPVGMATVVASLPGYASASSSPVQVAYNKSVTAPALTLTKAVSNGGAITGFVRLPGVTSLSGFAVTLAGPVGGATLTDSTGAYSFQSLPAGTYAIAATLPSTAEGTQTVEATVAQASVAAPDLKFMPLGSLSGTATLGSATGNAGIVIAVAGTALSATTDDAGQFAIQGVPVGMQTFIATMPGYVSGTGSVAVAYATTAQAPTLTLTASQPTVPSGGIQGTATLTGEMFNGVIAITLTGPSSGATTTNATGAYSFSGLPPGMYTVTAVAPSTVEVIQTAQVTVAASVAMAPALTFTPVGTITGTATLGSATGNAGITVIAVGTAAAATTNDAGAFTLRGVPVGTWTVSASYPGYASGMSPSVQVNYGSPTVGPAITLSAGASGTVNTIEGTAQLLGLTDYSGTTVSVAGTTLSTTTKADGTFSLAGAPDGAVTLNFSNGPFQDSVPVFDVPGVGSGVVQAGLTYPLPLNPIDVPRGIRLFHAAVPSLPSTSPDGSVAAWETPASGANVYSFISTVTGAAHTITLLYTGPMVFTPDSTRAFYWLRDGQEYALWSASVNTGATTMIAGQLPTVIGPAVSPDSTKVAFWTGSASPGYVLASAPVGGGSTTSLTGPLQGVDSLQYTADGKYILIRSKSNAFESVPSAGGVPVQIFSSAYYGFTKDLSLAYYVSNGAVWATPTEGGSAASIFTLPNGDTIDWCCTVSPDGSRIAFETRESPAGFFLYTVGNDGSNPRLIDTTPTVTSNYPWAGYGMVFSQDSTRVIWHYFPTSNPPQRIRICSASGGASMGVADTITSLPRPGDFLSDGHTFVAASQYILETVNSQSGAESMLAGNFYSADAPYSFGVSPDGSEIVYLSMPSVPSGPYTYVDIPISGGGPSPLLQTYAPASGSWGGGIGWLNDHRVLLTRAYDPAPFGYQDGVYSVPVP